MRIAIDISQIIHEGTGVAMYVRNLVATLLKIDKTNEYVLFGVSLRKRAVFDEFFRSLLRVNRNVHLITKPIPPTILEILWNRLHVVPAEWFVGEVDVFWSSDWVQPPLARAKGVTTIHDLIALKYPQETHPKWEFLLRRLEITPNIVEVQKRRLRWVAKECQAIFCDSEATKKDVIELLGWSPSRFFVVYPGFQFKLA